MPQVGPHGHSVYMRRALHAYRTSLVRPRQAELSKEKAISLYASFRHNSAWQAESWCR